MQLAGFHGEPALEALHLALAARRVRVALTWGSRGATAVEVDLTRAPPRPDAVAALIEEAGRAGRERSLELLFLVGREVEGAHGELKERFIVRTAWRVRRLALTSSARAPCPAPPRR